MYRECYIHGKFISILDTISDKYKIIYLFIHFRFYYSDISPFFTIHSGFDHQTNSNFDSMVTLNNLLKP